MTTRWFRRRWEESRGDEFDHWGAATYAFEVGEHGWPIRQLERYEAGPTLRYGPGHEQDEWGQLGQGPINAIEDWSPWAISRAEFEAEWDAPEPPAAEG